MFRATNGDGVIVGQWGNKSELETFLRHSVPDDATREAVRDENNYELHDRVGNVLFIVTGPAPKKPAETPNEV